VSHVSWLTLIAVSTSRSSELPFGSIGTRPPVPPLAAAAPNANPSSTLGHSFPPPPSLPLLSLLCLLLPACLAVLAVLPVLPVLPVLLLLEMSLLTWARKF